MSPLAVAEQNTRNNQQLYFNVIINWINFLNDLWRRSIFIFGIKREKQQDVDDAHMTSHTGADDERVSHGKLVFGLGSDDASVMIRWLVSRSLAVYVLLIILQTKLQCAYFGKHNNSSVCLIIPFALFFNCDPRDNSHSLRGFCLHEKFLRNFYIWREKCFFDGTRNFFFFREKIDQSSFDGPSIG